LFTILDGDEFQMNKLCRAIAYYLPQYHPIPENDVWWGKGFTEWTNTAKAKPLFPRHYQPHVPADLGFYDLRVPETRNAQAEMARVHGIEGFCYYHYWFAGKRLLERPFNEVLNSGEPNFPFCLCWANETWSGKWHGYPEKTLIKQTYPGRDDEERHFFTLLPAFFDDRYIKIDKKPVFLIYKPELLPDPKAFTDRWRSLALKEGLKGLYLIGMANEPWIPDQHGFDASTTKKPLHAAAMGEMRYTRKLRRAIRRLLEYPIDIYSYRRILPHLIMPEAIKANVHPHVIPNWDNTPRCGVNGVVIHGSTPELFRIHVRETLQQILHKPIEQRIMFIKSWNEWAEGNYMEPDLKFGKSYLEIFRDEIIA
jgi:lipopolysaccharide biosynthesis protein